jgi:hypothetical protein
LQVVDQGGRKLWDVVTSKGIQHYARPVQIERWRDVAAHPVKDAVGLGGGDAMISKRQDQVKFTAGHGGRQQLAPPRANCTSAREREGHVTA